MAAPSPVPIEDAVLVQRALAGDERAFAQLYRRHVRYVAGVLKRLLRRDDEVDDALQQTFTSALLSLASLREPEAFRGWVAAIAVRRARDRMALHQRQRWLAQAFAVFLPGHGDPAVRGEVDALGEALEALAPELRIAWVLHQVAGETLPEIATLTGTSLSTVKRRVSLAQERLERRLRAP